MTKKERLLLNEDLKTLTESEANLNEIANYLKKEIVKTRNNDRVIELSKYYENLLLVLGKIAITTKRWELYDYDSEN